MTIPHKITPSTPDSICEQCAQCYEGECLAFQMPHSQKERDARTTVYGMECDTERLKKLRHRRHGMQYRTPAGKYDTPYSGGVEGGG